MSDDIFYSFLGKGVALAFALLPLAPLFAQQPTPPPEKNIVQLHDAVTNGASWPKVILLKIEPDMAPASRHTNG